MAIYELVRLVIFGYLVVFFSAIAALKLAYSWFRKRGNFFYTRPHTKPEALNEWSDGFIQLSEVKLHYVEAGDMNKPLMLFVHGFPSFFYCWRHQLRHFKHNYRVVALDMRGYNESDKPQGVNNYTVDKLSRDVTEVIEKFGGKAILVGHDWGAVVCWTLARVRPELIQHLIIMNVPEPRAFREQISTNYRQLLSSWYMFMFQTPFLAEALFAAEDYRTLGLIIQKSIKDPKNFTDQDLECYKYAFSKPYGISGPLNYYRAAARSINKPQDQQAKIKPKTLIIWGELDVALRVEGAHGSLKYCEDGELKTLPDASHFVQEDEPDRVNRYMEEFLRKAAEDSLY